MGYSKLSTTQKIDVVLKSFSSNVSKSKFCLSQHVSIESLDTWRRRFIEAGTLGFSRQRKEKVIPLRLYEVITAVAEIQKDIIQKQNSLIHLYKDVLNRNKLSGRYRRLSDKRKIEIIKAVETSNLSMRKTLENLGVFRTSYYGWKKQYDSKKLGGTESELKEKKFEQPEYIQAVFSILHSPPRDFGFNRSSWRIPDIHMAMQRKGLPIGKNYILKIIKNAGYRFRSAKKVLTSTDPEYKEKLKQITAILSNLGPKDKFFSIDEFGPFSVKIQGGKSYVPHGHARVVPQLQKSKGRIILTGALELSKNQMTHFYSERKDTAEMIKLLRVLIQKYHDENSIYLSWDAASWHASKELTKEVDEHNRTGIKPNVKLAPLPACAQFLNVIESVFSGMAKAVIHNSDYQSVEECKTAIDLYFDERNRFFLENPKRAGNKIWGKERVEPIFSESNNCKDSRYLHDFKK